MTEPAKRVAWQKTQGPRYGLFLREWLRQNKMLNSRLAEIAGCSRQLITDHLNGDRSPDLWLLNVLAEIEGVPLVEILTRLYSDKYSVEKNTFLEIDKKNLQNIPADHLNIVYELHDWVSKKDETDAITGNRFLWCIRLLWMLTKMRKNDRLHIENRLLIADLTYEERKIPLFHNRMNELFHYFYSS